MSLTSLLENIATRQHQRRQTRWADYRNIVARICDGNEPDADELASILADTGRTLEELRDDTQLLARRRKLRVEMDAIVPLEKEAAKVAKQIKQAEAAFESSKAKHEQQTTPLYIRQSEIAAIRKRSSAARADLRQSCEDRELIAEYDAVIDGLGEAQRHRSQLDDEIRRQESWQRQNQEKADATEFDHERNRYRAQAQEHATTLASLRDKLEPADIEVANLEEQLSQIEERLLEP
jgi:chromosome segregation ATPase